MWAPICSKSVQIWKAGVSRQSAMLACGQLVVPAVVGADVIGDDDDGDDDDDDDDDDDGDDDDDDDDNFV